jgi:peptidoglycan/xylan/chitin deacetylase (PgdA/CDA1 family)
LLTTPAPAAAQAAAAPTAQVASAGTVTIPILMYHYVRVVNDPKDQVGINLSVRPEAFAAQMQYLADKGYTTLTMAEVHAILAGQQPVPPKPIALTFDDGYRDFYSAAWPVLQRHGFKATAYIATDFIGWDAYMTWPMLHELDASGLIEFGAHTRSHADLRTVSAARRWDEIIGSKAILEEGLGHPVGSFCYPAGFRNAEVVADVRRARFLTAVTVQHGKAQNLQWAYELPRIRVHGPDPLAAWASKLP